MALSLNQIISRIRSLALSHRQVNSFLFGDPWEFDANGDIDYGACFCEILPGSIDRGEKLQRFNFRLYFLDRVSVSADTEGNEQEVLSDMSSVAADMMAMLMYYEYEDDWLVSETGTVTAVTEVLGDMAAGVMLEISVGVDFIADRCQVPSTDVTFEEDFDMARTRIFKYTGTGSEGASFTPTDDDTGVTLAGRIVLSAYRAGTYKRPIITTPSDTDHIKVAGSVLTERKGILSTDGTVALQTGDALMSGEVLDFILWE